MLDALKFDKKTYPDTSYIANILITQSGFQWCLEFFYAARALIDAGDLNEKDVFLKFKGSVLKPIPKEGLFSVRDENIDWVALFNFIEEMTRPTKDIPGSSKTIIRVSDDILE